MSVVAHLDAGRPGPKARYFTRDVVGGRFDDIEDRLRWDRESLLPFARELVARHGAAASALWEEMLACGTAAGGRYDLIA
jgi:hypothetical protein